MKAAIYRKFGPPEVLTIQEKPKPRPKVHEILIQIHATTVEKEDPDMRRKPGLNGLFKPRKQILGMFLAGEIEEVGKEVTNFKQGDRIYGSAGMALGTTAEYICLPENSALVKIPDNISYNDAVSILNGGLTALPFLKEKGEIQSNQRVLINGASGSVGTMAVQIAIYFGADVTGVCSAKNLEYIKQLGVKEAIDYNQQDFTKSNQEYDIIFDTIGNRSFSECKSILSDHGIFLATVPKLGTMFQLLIRKLFGKKKVRFIAAGLRSVKKKIPDLLFLNQMFAENKLEPTIDCTYPLKDIAKAHEYVAQGHKRGSVVIFT